MTQIKDHLDSITAVLILANGTVPRVTVGTDYALSTLSDMFPNSLARNVSFMFTNVLSPLHWNFSLDSVPHALRDAPQFLLNNPIALQRKYLKLQNNPNMKKRGTDLRNAVKAGEQNALQMLVNLFDWLDGLEPQATTEIITRSQKREATSTNPPSPMDQEVSKDSAVSFSPGTSFLFFSFLLGIAYEPMVSTKFFQTPMGTEGKDVQVARTNEGPLKNSQEVWEVVWKLRRIFFGVSKQGTFTALCLCILSCMVTRFRVHCLAFVFPRYEVRLPIEWCVMLRICPSNAITMNLDQVIFTLAFCKDCLQCESGQRVTRNAGPV